MRSCCAVLGGLVLVLSGCSRAVSPSTPAALQGQQTSAAQPAADVASGRTNTGQYRGFDRNDYPGDDVMASLRKAPDPFAFTGYWLTNPPGENANTWVGKRALLVQQGWGFLVLANGRLDAEILNAQKAGTRPGDLGRQDAAIAVASAHREGFPAHTVIFLDQEEGGRLLPEQAAYLLGWTEAVAGSGFQPGAYASGQAVQDSPGATIDTIQDIRAQVKAGKLHEVAILDALDQCPPAPGCTLQPKPLSAAPDAGIIAWQYAQSPRRPEITQSCGKTYAADGNCYAPGYPQMFLDMDVAASADPSHGR